MMHRKDIVFFDQAPPFNYSDPLCRQADCGCVRAWKMPQGSLWKMLRPPPQPILWAAALHGGVVADCVCAASEGRRVAAFTYTTATQTSRRVFIDDDWAASNAELADILLTALEQTARPKLDTTLSCKASR